MNHIWGRKWFLDNLQTLSIWLHFILTSVVSVVSVTPVWTLVSSVKPILRQDLSSTEPRSSFTLSSRLLIFWASLRSVRVTPCRTFMQIHILGFQILSKRENRFSRTCVDLRVCLAWRDFAFLWDSASSSLTGVRYDLRQVNIYSRCS